jgi:hypothetical protein
MSRLRSIQQRGLHAAREFVPRDRSPGHEVRPGKTESISGMCTDVNGTCRYDTNAFSCRSLLVGGVSAMGRGGSKLTLSASNGHLA